MGSARMGNWSSFLDPGQGAAAIADPTVLPLAMIPQTAMSQQAVTLADLAAQGALMMPLAIDSQAGTGSLCQDFRRLGDQAILPVGPGREFSRKQGNLAAVVTWGPSKKIKGMQRLRIYNADNRLVAETAPGKINLQPRVTAFSAWKVPIGSLQPGIYRIDLLLDDEPQWRAYFRLVD